MTNKEIIESLRKSGLVATCSACGQEFGLDKATLFDGLGRFPEDAEARKQQLVGELLERIKELKERKISVENAEEKAIQVGIGKIVEKVVPAYRDFNLPLPDCRPLFEPIDLVVFNGASKNEVDSITFVEIKTGKARLNEHQKLVKEAVEKGDVGYKEV